MVKSHRGRLAFGSPNNPHRGGSWGFNVLVNTENLGYDFTS
jgi:hypothetical protein